MGKQTFQHLDASEGAYFARQLEHILGRTFDVLYPEAKALQMVPINTEVDGSDETVTYRVWDKVGTAKMISSYAEDFPDVEVFAKEYTSQLKGVGASYKYSLFEIRKAAKLNVPLDAKKAEAAKFFIDRKLDLIARTGDAGTNLLGLLNQPSAQTYTIPNDGNLGSTLWTSKTADQVARDMHAIWRTVVESTNDVEHPDTMLMPLSRFNYVATTRMSSYNDRTILEYFLATSPYVKTVMPWYALETAGASSTPRIVCYKKDPSKLEFFLPIPFEQLAPEQRGMVFKINCHARAGGVIAYYPASIVYADNM